MRSTKQKILIINIINNSSSHPSTHDIYIEARKKIPNISLGTVYRILNSLISKKQIIKIKIDGITRYDNSRVNHDHLSCHKCGTIIDIYEKSKLDYPNIDEHVIHNYSIIYEGICSKCLKEEK